MARFVVRAYKNQEPGKYIKKRLLRNGRTKVAEGKHSDLWNVFLQQGKSGDVFIDDDGAEYAYPCNLAQEFNGNGSVR